jgi:hypothetical protein
VKSMPVAHTGCQLNPIFIAGPWLRLRLAFPNPVENVGLPHRFGGLRFSDKAVTLVIAQSANQNTG